MTQIIHFTKMHALGNDFMMIDGINQSIRLTPEMIKQWSDRHCGVGFDQLLLIETPRSSDCDFFYRIFNADGNEVGQCGNGARCLGQFVWQNQLSDKAVLRIETSTTRMQIKRITENKIQVELAPPQFEPNQIPFVTTAQHAPYSLHVNDETINAYVVNVGNPHCVIAVHDVTIAPVNTLGAQLEQHPAFPERCNVGFMQIIDQQTIKLRVFERGIGETQACGSGAVAGAVIAQRYFNLHTPIKVELQGGSLEVIWQPENSILLLGEANTVYKGTL